MPNPALSRPADRGACLTIPEAAERLKLSSKTVRKLIASGALEGFFVTPRALRVRSRDLDSYLESVSTQRFSGGA